MPCYLMLLSEGVEPVGSSPIWFSPQGNETPLFHTEDAEEGKATEAAERSILSAASVALPSSASYQENNPGGGL